MPLGGFENDQLPMIDNENVIQNFEDVIEGFLQMEIAGRLVVAAAQNLGTVDPYLLVFIPVKLLLLAVFTSVQFCKTICFLHLTLCQFSFWFILQFFFSFSSVLLL